MPAGLNCFPVPGEGLPVRIWPGTIELHIQVTRSRARVNAFSSINGLHKCIYTIVKGSFRINLSDL